MGIFDGMKKQEAHRVRVELTVLAFMAALAAIAALFEESHDVIFKGLIILILLAVALFFIKCVIALLRLLFGKF